MLKSMQKHQSRHQRSQTRSDRRGGAVIIMVVALTTTLVIVGLFIFSFSDQAKINAQGFSSIDPVELDVDRAFDVALRQGIVSVPAEYENSALAAPDPANAQLLTFWSLLAHELGPMHHSGAPLTPHPHDGEGVRISYPDSNGDQIPDNMATLPPGLFYPDFRFDYDNDPATSEVLALNYTRLANRDTTANPFPTAPAVELFNPGLPAANRYNYLFRPDVGYTYPDINSLFLAQDYVDPQNGRRVIKPSFELPGYFPLNRIGQAQAMPPASGFGNFYIAGTPYSIAPNQSLRPHQGHRYGPVGNRYVVATAAFPAGVAAQSGDRNRLIPPFPFVVDIDGDSEDVNGNGILDNGETDANMNGIIDGGNERGAWDLSGDPTVDRYEFDVDADGDGIRDSIYIDLDHPIITLPGGRQVVPMYFWKIIDQDGLFNANMHGQQPLLVDASNQGVNGAANIYQQIFVNQAIGLDGTQNTANLGWAHYSNMGLSPAEVNLSIGLYANPTGVAYVDADSGNPQFVDQTALWRAMAQHQGYLADYFTSPPNPQSRQFLITDPMNPEFRYRNRVTIANLETAMMLFGSPEYSRINTNLIVPPNYTYDNAGFDIAGRFGRDGDLRTALEASIGRLAAPGTPIGVAGADDNGDDTLPANNPTTANASLEKGGIAYPDPRIGLQVPSFVHPLDYAGIGHHTMSDNGEGEAYRLQSASLTLNTPGERVLGEIDPINTLNSPVRGVKYPLEGRWQTTGTPLAGQQNLRQDAPNLFPPPPPLMTGDDLLLNDASEFHPYASLRNGNDNPFEPSEIAALQLTDADWTASPFDSRLRALLPFNFSLNRQAAAIRSQYTTESWDRTEFGLTYDPSRGWEFNIGNDPNVANPIPIPGYFTGKFPPVLHQDQSVVPVGPVASRHEDTDPLNPASYDATTISRFDPMRPEVRRLLTVDRDATARDRTKFPQMRLKMNRILSDDVLFLSAAPANPYNLAAFDRAGNPKFRHLIPHPELLIQDPANPPVIEDMIHENLTGQDVSALPATHPIRRFDQMNSDPLVQEWWAQYDRQRLARDIYVLLRTIGYGSDTQTGWSGTGGTGDPEFIKDCAQFAVNYVDAMDRDSVITKFYYDENLTDGWEVNNPSSLLFVYGLEEQKLVFSESLLAESEAVAEQNDTLHREESTLIHRFLYLELRNTSPLPVKLNRDGWRLVRIQDITDTAGTPFMPDGDLDEVASVNLRPLYNLNTTTPVATPDLKNNDTVPGGGNFLVGCHDGTVVNADSEPIGSEFFAMTPSGTELEPIVPFGPANVIDNTQVPGIDTAPDNSLDLDFTSAGVTSAANMGSATEDRFSFANPTAFVMADGMTPATTLVETIDPGQPKQERMFISLQRRQHLIGDGIGDWVEIDRVEVIVPEPGGSMDGYPDASVERSHQYILEDPVRRNPGSNPERKNSMDGRPAEKHKANEYYTANFATLDDDGVNNDQEIKLWQPHFDRDLSSLIDLLSIPLFGWHLHEAPFEEKYDPAAGFRNNGLVGNLVSDEANHEMRLSGHRTAQTRFLFPNRNDLDTMTLPVSPIESNGYSDWTVEDNVPEYSNKWHRILELLEIDSRADDVVDVGSMGGLALERRIPGKINLNTLRHDHVLAGLVDDDIHHNTINNLIVPLPTTGPDDRLYPPTVDTFEGTDRWWFKEFLLSRDGYQINPRIDPLLNGNEYGTTGFSDLPGTPHARPFKPLAKNQITLNNEIPIDPIEQTILRRRPGNPTSPPQMPPSIPEAGLFEARAKSDYAPMISTDPVDVIDYHTRQRILAKIANNSTERSHVFGIWLGFDLHEAHQITLASGAVVPQIGGRAEDLPRYRMFCVVDMSRLEEAYNPTTGTYDFRKFIIHRQLLK